MSDTTISISNAGASYFGLLGELVHDSEAASQRVDLLTQQTGDGLISDRFSGLGSGSKLALDLGSEIQQDSVWSQNITEADSTISLTQTAMNQLGSIASNFYNLTESMTGVDPSAIDGIASQAQTALQEVAGLLDTTDAGNYIFAGQDTGNPPVPNPSDIASSSFYTSINSLITSELSSGTDGYTIGQNTLTLATTNSPFSSTISSTRTSVTVVNNQQIPIGIIANQNAAVTSSGTSTTGSYMLDLMRALATLGSMSSSQVSDTGFATLVADTRTSLGGAMTAMDNEEGILGDTQARIDATGTILSATTLALTTQLSGVEDADLASVATQLTAAQTQLTASYKLIASVGSLSLVNYI
jgi:flagellar hook-associated protein 3 FlgL